MKRLLLPILLLLLTGCKYGSEYEALSACDKWREKQWETQDVSIECRRERSTRKILAIVSERGYGSDKVVKKRFAY